MNTLEQVDKFCNDDSGITVNMSMQTIKEDSHLEHVFRMFDRPIGSWDKSQMKSFESSEFMERNPTDNTTEMLPKDIEKATKRQICLLNRNEHAKYYMRLLQMDVVGITPVFDMTLHQKISLHQQLLRPHEPQTEILRAQSFH